MFKAAGAVALLAVVGAAAVMLQRRATPRFEREIPWATSGVWLKAETHVHSRFSDGGHTIDELVDRAVANGCDVLAITDHTDSGLKAATPEYHAALAEARARRPELILLTGFEWNVPPGKGQDHAVVLAPPGADAPEAWAEFKTRFDDLDKEGENPELALEAFNWLGARPGTERPLVFLDHPSRRAGSVDAVAQQLEFLLKAGEGVLVGVEGAPGHQKAKPLGAYGGAMKPDDRWDPAIAPPGGAWDRQLAARRRLWGALATADFHSESNGDYWPCQFSATWIYAPERSATGVFKALRAGSFVGVHGDIARDVRLSLAAKGLPRPAVSGESVRLRSGTPVTIELSARVPATDWEGQPNRVDVFELIGATPDGTTIIHSGALDERGTLRHELNVPGTGIVVRARGRRVEDGPDLLFYSNPIEIGSN